MESYIIFFTLISFLLSVVMSFATIPLIIKFCNYRKLYDYCDKRKIHTKDIPRLGGIVFLPSIALSVLFVYVVCALFEIEYPEIMFNKYIGVAVGFVIVFLTGIRDDISVIIPVHKLFMQIIAATLFVLSGLHMTINGLNIAGATELNMLLTIFILIYISNAMNFIDGIDGLCGSIAIMTATAATFNFVSRCMVLPSVVMAGTAGAVCAFLYYNMSEKKKIFMGDTGSMTLGFVLGVAMIDILSNGVAGTTLTIYSWIVALTVMFIPIMDLLRVVLNRLIHRKNIMIADKSHIHHKIMIVGFSQHKSLIVITAIISVFVIINLLLVRYLTLILIFFTDIVMFVLFNVIVNAVIKRNKKHNQCEE